jgi:hypothetical protein
MLLSILNNVKTIDEAIGSSMPQNVSAVPVNYNICEDICMYYGKNIVSVSVHCCAVAWIF